MPWMTLRVPDDLLDRIRLGAHERNISMNEFVTRTMDAATNLNLEGSEAERLRARLAAAELLVVSPTYDRIRPPREEFEAARRAAGRGTPLSDIVTADRG